jgi:hypothetical protein
MGHQRVEREQHTVHNASEARTVARLEGLEDLGELAKQVGDKRCDVRLRKWRGVASLARLSGSFGTSQVSGHTELMQPQLANPLSTG